MDVSSTLHHVKNAMEADSKSSFKAKLLLLFVAARSAAAVGVKPPERLLKDVIVRRNVTFCNCRNKGISRDRSAEEAPAAAVAAAEQQTSTSADW